MIDTRQEPSKLFDVTIRAFGKHIVERVTAHSRADAEAQVLEKYGVQITVAIP